jgi:protein arginine kinase
VEKHLISPDLAKSPVGGVALRGDNVVSIMINEEDHLRIQCLLPGLQLQRALDIVNSYDDLIESEMPYAFHEDYGYLTSCPTNAGTGMRASVMAHLPALVNSGQIGRVLAAIGQFGLMARGLYGEGTQAVGNIFQISNQVTCGLAEEEILKNLSSVVERIVAQERTVLREMSDKNRHHLEDKVFRALGILKNARVLTSSEAMALLSDMRMGVSAHLVDIKPSVLTELMVSIQPGALQKSAGKPLDGFERDLRRALVVRNRLDAELREV